MTTTLITLYYTYSAFSTGRHWDEIMNIKNRFARVLTCITWYNVSPIIDLWETLTPIYKKAVVWTNNKTAIAGWMRYWTYGGEKWLHERSEYMKTADHLAYFINVQDSKEIGYFARKFSSMIVEFYKNNYSEMYDRAVEYVEKTKERVEVRDGEEVDM
jgi:hypothetical protein